MIHDISLDYRDNTFLQNLQEAVILCWILVCRCRYFSAWLSNFLIKIAARALVTYLIPGCVGRGVRLGSESSSGCGGFWKSGNLEIWEFGDPGGWKSRNWDPKNEKIKNLKIQIRSAQNVGKVWISRKKIILAPLGATSGHFFHGPKKPKNT